MRYKHYETPMDWLAEKSLPMSTFLFWPESSPGMAIVADIAFCGEMSFDGGETEGASWDDSLYRNSHWRPFADIEALDNTDPLLESARINKED